MWQRIRDERSVVIMRNHRSRVKASVNASKRIFSRSRVPLTFSLLTSGGHRIANGVRVYAMRVPTRLGGIDVKFGKGIGLFVNSLCRKERSAYPSTQVRSSR